MALYHTHRPQQFDAVIGQEHIVQTLSNQVTHERLGHAYLFSGPRGIGKTTTARIIAKAANCTNRKKNDPNPCGQCSSCTEIREGRSIDVIEIDAASHTGVDHVREHIIENAKFRPTKSRYKVFIIDEVHMLSTSAFNALLKTLEEPPQHVLFILATTEVQKLPPTVISRCQHFTFSTVPYETLKIYLQDLGKSESASVDDAVLDQVIHKSGGCVRDAVNLLDQLLSSGEKKITPEIASLFLPASSSQDVRDLAHALYELNSVAALTVINKVVQQGGDVVNFVDATIALCRSALLSHMEDRLWRDITMDAATQQTILTFKQKLSPTPLMELIDGLLDCRNKIKRSPLPQLPLEVAVIGFVIKHSQQQREQTSGQSKPLEASNTTPPVIPEQPTQKKTVSVRVKEFIHKEEHTSSLDEQAVRQQWPVVITSVEPISPSLVFILQMAHIVRVEGQRIILGVPYQFHKDKLMEKTTLKKLVDLVSSTVGSRVELLFEVQDTQRDETTVASGSAQELAAAFGGDVV